MNIDTVVISTKEYNNLRDFKTEIENGNTIAYGVWSERYHIISKDEALEEVGKENKRLEIKIAKLKEELKGKKEETIQTIKDMNLFQVIKWKLKNK